jgi:hypothetical protein
MDKLSFVPSLEWWATRTAARHMKHCTTKVCPVCARAANRNALQHAIDRIGRALRGEDALEWVRLVVPHENADLVKALTIISYMTEHITVNPATKVIKGTREIKFTLKGVPVSVQVTEYEAPVKNGHYLQRGDQYLLVSTFPVMYFRVPLKEPSAKMEEYFRTAFAHYELGHANAEPLHERTRHVLNELIANDILRAEWIPLSKVLVRWGANRVLRAEYAQCEYDQLSEATTTIIKV